MKNRKIWIALAIIVVLVGSYFMSGPPPASREAQVDPNIVTGKEEVKENGTTSDKKTEGVEKDPGDKTIEKEIEKDKESKDERKEESEYEKDKKEKEDAKAQAEQKKDPQDPADKKPVDDKKSERRQDKYLTDPVPGGKPQPIEPGEVAITDKEMTATLSVRCDTLLANLDRMDPEKVELVPKDGVIFPATQVTFYEGESVFNVLQREMKKNKVHMEFRNTPKYNSAYIEGIHNLYEFDGGQLSGWMYKVNGWFPNYGCSRYGLKNGDVIEWVYTCDLGRDVGGYVEGVEIE
ncbi:MAG: DUF4430 domain-containing protein [Peptostreptococcaceae bacterium]|nr:DUF4430 domain-containing protein [Peptostreptococcaceae bacterium]